MKKDLIPDASRRRERSFGLFNVERQRCLSISPVLPDNKTSNRSTDEFAGDLFSETRTSIDGKATAAQKSTSLPFHICTISIWSWANVRAGPILFRRSEQILFFVPLLELRLQRANLCKEGDHRVRVFADRGE
jgi:hypothetical protein